MSSSSKGGELKRELSVVLLTGLGVGSVIGSGIYMNPGIIASVAGPLSIVATIIMGIMTCILTYIIAELNRAFPKEGSIHYYARELLGDLTGFITAMIYYFTCWIGSPPIIYAFILYLSYYIPGLAIRLNLTPLGILLALIILAIFTWINVIGVKQGVGLNFVFTVLKVIPLFIFIIVAFTRFNVSNLEPFAPFGLKGIGLATAFVFWMFSGFESIVLVTEEVKYPEKTVKQAAYATVTIITLIYVLVMTTFIGSINWGALGFAIKDWESLGELSSPLSDVSNAFGAPWLANLVFAGAMASTAGCFAAWVLFSGRVAFALAREERFWRPLAYIHPRYGTPTNALIFTSILMAIIMLLIPSFPNVVLITMSAEFILYAISGLCIIVLRRSFKWILLGWIAFFVSSLYVYWCCWPWTLVGAIIVIASLILYPTFVKNVSFLSELKKTTWYIVYVIILAIISLLGDPIFEWENFLPISPLGIFPMPYDIVVIAIFATIVFIWIYKIYSQKK